VPIEVFTNETGPKNGDSVETELDAFILMFPATILEIMVKETNSFASKTEIGWTDVSHNEMWCYIGCLLFMGVVRLNALDSFWSNDIQGQPFIRSLLKKKRFFDIHRNLHFSDNGTRDTNDKLSKIRGVVEILQFSFQANWNPSQYITIDETMVPFKVAKSLNVGTVSMTIILKGRVGFRQHIPRKPTHTGIKIWSVADGSNYLYHFVFYLGKEKENNHDEPRRNLTLSQRVVMYMESKIPPGIGIFLFFCCHSLINNGEGPFVFLGDNFFGSWKAAFMLHQKKRLFLLNCKKTQPTAIFSNILLAKGLGKMKEGDFRWVMRNPHFLAISWQDSGL